MSTWQITGGRMHVNGLVLSDENFDFVSDGTWFVKGSRCSLLINCGGSGLFEGPTTNYPGRPEGCEERVDEETCGWEEFDILDKSGKLIAGHADEDQNPTQQA